jgi:hypothetical protein
LLREPAGARLRVEMKTTREPSSLTCAERLSSATKGSKVAAPARGGRLASVFVTRVKVPCVRSTAAGVSPLVRSAAGTSGMR